MDQIILNRKKVEELKNSTDPLIKALAEKLCELMPHPPSELPTKPGDYLVIHYRYGPCIWGFVTNGGWGDYKSSTNPTGDPGILGWAELPFK